MFHDHPFHSPRRDNDVFSAQQVADTYVTMLNSHDADPVDRCIAVDYVNHNPFVAPDGKATGSSGRSSPRPA
jgi:hypothetical protein